jgi:hypothetical protein
MGQHQSLVDLGLALGLLLLLDFPFLLSFLFGYYTIHWEDHSLSDFCCGAIFHQFYVNVKMWVDSTDPAALNKKVLIVSEKPEALDGTHHALDK